VTLTINGEEKTLADSLTLAELIANLGMKSDRVAVELNREIVSRQNWPATRLKNGDRLEIVHFVGGGCFFNIPSAPREP
jgi:sulfur carrier protein